jgi:hypothetical protein
MDTYLVEKEERQRRDDNADARPEVEYWGRHLQYI